MIGIVWNAFCNAFTKGLGIDLSHGLILLIMLSALHSLSLYAFNVFFKVLKFPKEEVTAASFCASHKTLAFGLPLVNTIFEGNPNLAAYCAPIMFIHPLQLVLGSIFASRFESYTSKDKEI